MARPMPLDEPVTTARRPVSSPPSAGRALIRRRLAEGLLDVDPDAPRSGESAPRELLEELSLPSFLKTTGSKGFHIVVPLDATAGFEEVASFAHSVGALLVRRDPKNLTQEFSKADRGGRIYVDTGRNGYSATFAAVYSVRAKPGAPVSAPCTWEELERGEVGPRTFTLRSMASRIEKVSDLWSSMRGRGRSLRRAEARLRQLGAS